ncbi:ArnT family glycosyltransferase [Phaeocystidibacter marisrubri]|uniref:Glycosyltransferase RgtA/B/C/D-like domain-containing protein n=1 Tax=Phaeocystidibacter marisrubri TaxID=1577780 RepID=A0A6L3ZET9_9FLAO|nr:hypothetical protein [Phaeocystidibacter marisrubri]KAB2816004.1 hypothetical protein F8C82_09930 [Phaeocystidibacter marisrubri]GGH66841.1 hypothetical protein GCM10011318_05210 [Phaeocystidibacter marisrubri]
MQTLSGKRLIFVGKNSAALTKQSLYGLLASLFGLYVVLRSAWLSFTIDEAMSYNYVVGLWGEEMNIANNHFLNTQLMKLSQSVFGSSAFALRLPNVLSFFLYAWSVSQIVRYAKTNWLYFTGAILLLALPFPLEFFALARGYGLSMAFSAFAIAQIMKAFSKNGEVHLVYASLGAGLAVLSNNAVLNVSIVMWIMILAGFVVKWKKGFTSRVMVSFGVSLIIALSCLSFSVMELLELRALGELFFGTDSYASFGDHLISNFLYTDTAVPIMKPLTLIPLLLFVLVGVLRVLSTKLFHPLFVVSSLLLFVSLLGWVLEHELFDALLPRTRTGIIYVPLISLWAFSIGVALEGEAGKWRKFFQYLLMAMGLVWALNFGLFSNFSHARDWRYSAKMEEIMTRAGQIASIAQREIEIEKPALYRSNVNYYVHSRSYPISIDWKEDISFTKELVLARPQDIMGNVPSNYEVVLDYSEYETILLVRKDVLNRD